MKNFDKSFDNLIDEFYNEEFCKVADSHISSNENINFKEKLHKTNEKLKLLETDPINLNINLESVINQAIEIKSTKKSRIEFILFMAVSTVILAILGFISFSMGVRSFIISQVVITAILPWSLIPLSIIKVKGSDL